MLEADASELLDPYGSEKPSIVFVTAHPATVQLEYILYDSLHRFDLKSSFTLELLVLRSSHEFSYLLATLCHDFLHES